MCGSSVVSSLAADEHMYATAGEAFLYGVGQQKLSTDVLRTCSALQGRWLRAMIPMAAIGEDHGTSGNLLAPERRMPALVSSASHPFACEKRRKLAGMGIAQNWRIPAIAERFACVTALVTAMWAVGGTSCRPTARRSRVSF